MARMVRMRDVRGRFTKNPATLPFRFLDSAPEIRNRIYDMVVHPFRAPVEQRARSVEAESQQCDCDIMLQVSHHECVNSTEEEFLIRDILPGPASLFYVKSSDMRGNIVIDSKPAILEVNHQTRREALALFYSDNTFVFAESEHFVAKDWLFEVVGWENMKHVRRLFCEFDDTDAPSEQDLVAFAVVILLMELRLLKCQLRVTYLQWRNDHIGCKLREKIRELIAEEEIVKTDVEGKDVAVLENLVANTVGGWRVLWMDDVDTLELGDENLEAELRCTVCGEDDGGDTLDVPPFESLDAVAAAAGENA